MLGKKTRNIGTFALGLVLAIAIYLIPGMTGIADAKEAFAEQKDQRGRSKQSEDKECQSAIHSVNPCNPRLIPSLSG